MQKFGACTVSGEWWAPNLAISRATRLGPFLMQRNSKIYFFINLKRIQITLKTCTSAQTRSGKTYTDLQCTSFQKLVIIMYIKITWCINNAMSFSSDYHVHISHTQCRNIKCSPHAMVLIHWLHNAAILEVKRWWNISLVRGSLHKHRPALNSRTADTILHGVCT